MLIKHGNRITFVLDTAGRQFHSVAVAGEFNGWNPATPQGRMVPDADNPCRWQVTLTLPPGDYQFRYVADGVWLDEPSADGMVVNQFGTRNALVRVPEPIPEPDPEPAAEPPAPAVVAQATPEPVREPVAEPAAEPPAPVAEPPAPVAKPPAPAVVASEAVEPDLSFGLFEPLAEPVRPTRGGRVAQVRDTQPKTSELRATEPQPAAPVMQAQAPISRPVTARALPPVASLPALEGLEFPDDEPAQPPAMSAQAMRPAGVAAFAMPVRAVPLREPPPGRGSVPPSIPPAATTAKPLAAPAKPFAVVPGSPTLSMAELPGVEPTSATRRPVTIPPRPSKIQRPASPWQAAPIIKPIKPPDLGR